MAFYCSTCKDYIAGIPDTNDCPKCHKAWEWTMTTTSGYDGQGNVQAAELADEVMKTMNLAFGIWKDRQRKYGPQNIAFAGAQGCFVRSLDKLSRLRGVYLDRKGDMPDESINDTWLDLVNYAVMGYLCHNGKWPGTEK